MRKRVLKNKLNNSNGASILIALFVLLVSVVISSILITAARASAGRIVNVAKTDQRYCTITSAANILKETIEDNSVIISRKYDGTNYNFYFARESTNTNGEKEYIYSDLKKGLGVLNDIAIDYGFIGKLDENDKVIENKANYDININELNTINLPNDYQARAITIEASDDRIASTKATIELTRDKRLILLIYDGESGVGHYNLRYTYSCDIQEYEDINENEGTRTKYTKFNWVLEKVEKI